MQDISSSSSREAKIQELIEQTGAPSPKNVKSENPGKGRIMQAVGMEVELTGNPMAFAFKMFKCYQKLSADLAGSGYSDIYKEALECLGNLTEAALYEGAGLEERDVFACR